MGAVAFLILVSWLLTACAEPTTAQTQPVLATPTTSSNSTEQPQETLALAVKLPDAPIQAPATYVVLAGDNPTAIARKLGVPEPQTNSWVSDLLVLNSVSDARFLAVGQVLRLPGSPAKAASLASVPAPAAPKPAVAKPAATPVPPAPTQAPLRAAAPTATPVPPGQFIPYAGNGGGPTQCRDGSYSHSSGRGTCSHHGGVAH